MNKKKILFVEPTGAPSNVFAKFMTIPLLGPIYLATIARKAGLRYVYIGNVEGIDGGSTTYCPNCKRIVVDRRGYRVVTMDVQGAKCRFCKTPIAGVWTA